MPPTVCLVTPGHVASTPRLVKEADALCAAGFHVCVVAGRHHEPVIPLDDEILAHAPWRYHAVDYGPRKPGHIRKIARHLARALIARRADAPFHVAARALHSEAFRFADAATKTGADFFLGHCLAGIAAATLAAARRHVRFGCDLEDFHDSETLAASTTAADRHATRRLLSSSLPRAAHLTASAPLIARAYERDYGVRPLVVLNVFSRRDAPAAPVDVPLISLRRPARLYWFSQTVGPGRGLEATIAMLGHLRTPAVLQLRGFIAPEYRARIQSYAAGGLRPVAVEFLEPAPPTDMVRLAAAADLGLSVEEPQPANRDLCLTNKIFTYLLAGVPVLLSPTSAQLALAAELGPAALPVSPDPREVAAQLDSFFAAPDRIKAARRAAWDIGQTQFCWDVEEEKFIAAVRLALAGS